MSRRELFPELTPKLLDLQNAQNMFIRTLFFKGVKKVMSNIKEASYFVELVAVRMV